MSKDVFFHKTVNNTIIVKSKPLSTRKTVVNGQEVYTREQGQVTYGLLCLIDANGQAIDPSTLGLKANQLMKGIRLSDSPEMDQDDPTVETGMYWAESY